MKKNENRPEIVELPPEIRNFILNEVEYGLTQFRSADFDARLKNGLRAESTRAERPFTPNLRRWAPVLGLTLAAVLVGMVFLWLSRVPRPGATPEGLAASLAGLPGFQTLNKAALDQDVLEHDQSLGGSSFLRSFTEVVAASDAAEPDTSGEIDIVPRYSLEQKLEILLNEQPIERALALITSKKGEV